MAASFAAPWNRDAIRAQGEGLTGEAPGDLFGHLMQIQMYQQQQQRLAATQAAIPGLVKSMNLDPSMVPILQNNPDMVASLVQAHQPEGIYKNYTLAREYYIKNNSDPNDPQSQARARAAFEQKVPIVNALTPSGGDPELNAFNLEHNQYLSTNGGQEPDDNRFSDPQALKNWKAHNAALSNSQTAAQQTFSGLNGQLVQKSSDIDELLKSPQDLEKVLNIANNPVQLGIARNAEWVASKVPSGSGLDLTQDQLNMLHKIDDLSSWNTTGIKQANPHLVTNILGIDQNLAKLQHFGVGIRNYTQALNDAKASILGTRAQAIGSSGMLDKAVGDDDVEGLIDPSYLPGGQNYLGEPKPVTDAARAWAKQQLADGAPPATIIQRLKLKGYNPKPGQIPGVI